MTQIEVKKRQKLAAEIVLPASKSISNRALIINALSGTQTLPQNVSDCDDTRVMVRALQQTGALALPTGEIAQQANAEGGKDNDCIVIDIMAAGTAMRFLTAYLSTTEGEYVLTGTERMKHRPIGILVDALRSLGADIQYENEEGFPPLRIKGHKLEGGSVEIAGSVSSQYISAMLMIGPVLERGLRLTLSGGIVSRPYIEMTLGIMRDFGAEATFEGNCIEVKPTGYTPIPYYIENDWSASSYWFEMAAFTPESEIRLPGLFEQSLQGDQGVKEIFKLLGVSASPSEQGGFTLRHTGQTADRLDIDMLKVPDLAQTVVVTCAMLNIPFRITGLQSLKIKETDRIAALRTELRKLGFLINEAEDSILYWDGERCEEESRPAIDTYEDHRMAMSFAPCCQVLESLLINHPEVVSKSYPRYWEDLKMAGLIVEKCS